jgi:hypothetical protein
LKHATDQALDQLEDLLEDVRKLGKLTEKKRGIFYLKSVAFLHFHEDPAGLFADLKSGDGFTRFPVNRGSEKLEFFGILKKALDG